MAPNRCMLRSALGTRWTTERPYKRASSEEHALAHLMEGAGIHFDPRVVVTFLGRWRQIPDFLEAGQGTIGGRKQFGAPHADHRG